MQAETDRLRNLDFLSPLSLSLPSSPHPQTVPVSLQPSPANHYSLLLQKNVVSWWSQRMAINDICHSGLRQGEVSATRGGKHARAVPLH